MNSGICLCMLLAALSSAGVGQPSGLPAQAAAVFGPAARSEPSVAGRGRQVRSAPLGDSLKALDEPSLGQLLAQYLSRKAENEISEIYFVSWILEPQQGSIKLLESKKNKKDGHRLSFKAADQGPNHRSSKAFSRTTGPRVGHRIQDRDYLGWMDFGRRSAEEYEYSS